MLLFITPGPQTWYKAKEPGILHVGSTRLWCMAQRQKGMDAKSAVSLSDSSLQYDEEMKNIYSKSEKEIPFRFLKVCFYHI